MGESRQRPTQDFHSFSHPLWKTSIVAGWRSSPRKNPPTSQISHLPLSLFIISLILSPSITTPYSSTRLVKSSTSNVKQEDTWKGNILMSGHPNRQGCLRRSIQWIVQSQPWRKQWLVFKDIWIEITWSNIISNESMRIKCEQFLNKTQFSYWSFKYRKVFKVGSFYLTKVLEVDFLVCLSFSMSQSFCYADV